jgi:hypothetical protein
MSGDDRSPEERLTLAALERIRAGRELIDRGERILHLLHDCLGYSGGNVTIQAKVSDQETARDRTVSER